MPRRKPTTKTGPEVEDYRHGEKRTNNPPAGIMGDYGPQSAPSKRKYEYNPHLDPQLVWAGKAEHTSFEVENVPLYIHERISTQAILRAVKREDVNRSLFADPDLSLRETVECYRHPMDWANRLILGDSLVVMNSLLERERMAGQVQMIYLDPPYGIGYNSNFQPRTDKRDVKDGADEDLTREPEQISAYRDTWSLGIHSYLTYLRDRLLLAKELLSETGSVFVQIGDENVHLVRAMMDEVFGRGNFVALIAVTKTGSLTGQLLSSVTDYLLWGAREKGCIKHRKLFDTRAERDEDDSSADPLKSEGPRTGTTFDYEFEGRTFPCRSGEHWKVPRDGLDRLAAADRLVPLVNSLRFRRLWQDFPVKEFSNVWTGFGGAADIVYVVQTNRRMVERCLLMTTDPGDLVLDPTCGSGTTAYVAEQWGRRWITCDTSRVAMFLARQRLLTAKYDYYALADEKAGVRGGFRYKTVPHITLKSIANNPELDPEKVEARREAIREQVLSQVARAARACEVGDGTTAATASTREPRVPPDIEQEVERRLREANEAIIRANADQETLYDQPEFVRNKVRVSGPFTVEAIPPPSVEADVGGTPGPGVSGEETDELDGATALTREPRVPPTQHIETLIEHLRKDGVTFPGGKKMAFASLTGCGSGVIHAEGEPGNGNG